VGVSVIAVDGARAYVQPLLLILDQPDAILIVNVSPGMHLRIQAGNSGAAARGVCQKHVDAARFSCSLDSSFECSTILRRCPEYQLSTKTIRWGDDFFLP
jgi:hypothetical protein